MLRRAGSTASRVCVLVVVGLRLRAGSVHGAEIKVMISGGFAAAYRDLVADFERSTGHTAVTARGPSMGVTPEAIPNRLQRGEAADALIMVGAALDELVQRGHVVMGGAVRAGAVKPDISSVEAFKRALLEVKAIAYSDSASGVYLSTGPFPRLGIADEVKGKSKKIEGDPVGSVVARGEAEIGFQQISELLPVSGIDFVGPLPPESRASRCSRPASLCAPKNPRWPGR
jgi:molybdate transport system substrate-binding protein